MTPPRFPPDARTEPLPEQGYQKPRRRWLGSLVAIILVLALGALAWYLTHRPPLPPEGGRPGFAMNGASGASGAGAGGAGARAGGRGGPGGARGGPPSTVGVANARHADIPVIIEALGTVTSVANVTVAPQVSGVITQVNYKEGQMVEKGQVLATIDPQPFQATLAQATGARMRDEAQLSAAKVMLDRYRLLLKQDSIAGQTVDTQDALVGQLTGTVAVDKANEDTARLNLKWSRVVAPVAGRVGLRPVDAGNYVSAGSSTGVATITQISPIDIAFSIPQVRVPEIQERMASTGGAVQVTAWDSTRTRQLDVGTFSTMDNQIDTTTGTVKAKARFTNAKGVLFPNQFVNVRLLVRTIDAAVVVPVTALRHGSNGDYVYVVDAEHTVEMRTVTAGISGVDDVAITSGLDVGEQVVTEGGDRLRDGSRVQTNADRPAGAASGAASGARGARRHGGAASGAYLGGPEGAGASGPRHGRRASQPDAAP